MRRTTRLLAVLSGLACAGTVALWVRGYFASDAVRVENGKGFVAAISGRGGVALIRMRYGPLSSGPRGV